MSCHAAENIHDPSWGTGCIGEQRVTVRWGKVAPEPCDDVVIDEAFANPAQREDDLGALGVFRRDEPRRNMPENEFTFPLFDSTASTSGQQHWTHGNLIRKAQRIRGMGTRGQDARVVLAGNGIVERR